MRQAVTVLIFAFTLFLHTDCLAQQTRPTGGGTIGGGSTASNTSSGRSVGGSISAGQRTLTGSSANRGGAGGQGGFSNIGSMNEQQVSQAGQLSNSERFVRGNRQGGTFVGADSGDAALRSLVAGGRVMSSLQGLRQLQQTFNPNTEGQEDNERKYRIQIQTAFDYPPPAAPAITVNLQRQLGPTSQLSTLGPIRVEIQGRTATLSGTVASEHTRALAEKVALLEPGISAVRNELTVSAAPAAQPAPLQPAQARPLP
jgi:osmotically-inducible protein OsmY